MKKREQEKVNLISPCKLDSPAFSNSCFRATASMGRWKVHGGRRKEGKREDKSMQGRAEGEREAVAALPQADSNQ